MPESLRQRARAPVGHARKGPVVSNELRNIRRLPARSQSLIVRVGTRILAINVELADLRHCSINRFRAACPRCSTDMPLIECFAADVPTASGRKSQFNPRSHDAQLGRSVRNGAPSSRAPVDPISSTAYYTTPAASHRPPRCRLVQSGSRLLFTYLQGHVH